jgi:predicted HAD superfamily Cof-like phosphohydrolase
MIAQLEMVEAFHKANLVPQNLFPGNVDKKTAELRYKLLLEELNEYQEACENNDLPEIADALADQLYIVLGSILVHGMKDIIIPIFEEVQKSNMSKLDENGNPVLNGVNCPFDETRPHGKVMKSKLFSPPNIEQFL